MTDREPGRWPRTRDWEKERRDESGEEGEWLDERRKDEIDSWIRSTDDER